MAMRQKYRCAADGCDRPTAWADAHHLHPWSRGGRTDLDDGVMICGAHHRLAHHPDYTVQTTRPAITITRSHAKHPDANSSVRATCSQGELIARRFPLVPRSGPS
jgi:hypothetical protein